jgi:hypothetical protein
VPEELEREQRPERAETRLPIGWATMLLAAVRRERGEPDEPDEGEAAAHATEPPPFDLHPHVPPAPPLDRFDTFGTSNTFGIFGTRKGPPYKAHRRQSILAMTALLVVTVWLGSVAGGRFAGGQPVMPVVGQGQPAKIPAPVAGSGAHAQAHLPSIAPVPHPQPESPAPVSASQAPVPAQAPEPPAPASPSDDASRLTDAIERSERVLHDPHAAPSQVEEAARVEQLVFRTLAEHPGLQPAVLPLLDPQARASADHAVLVGTALRSVIAPQRKLPDWRIVEPAPAQRLLSFYREAESTFGVPWEYLAAIHLVETRMGRIRGASASGAQGPMQFLPQTWERYGVGNINSDHDAIMAAARMLHANGAPADIARALHRYNPSRQYVEAITAYAEQMTADERAFFGFYHWQVLYRHVDGTVLLPVGYPSATPTPVDRA